MADRHPSRLRLLTFAVVVTALGLLLAEGLARALAGPPASRYLFDGEDLGLSRSAWLSLFGEDLDSKAAGKPLARPADQPWLTRIQAPGGQEALTRNPAKMNFRENDRNFFILEKPQGVRRIFCLGGSTVQGIPGAVEQAFSDHLQSWLDERSPGRVEVYNMGNPGLDSFDLTSMMPELLPLAPDLFIVYAGHNDCGNTFFRGNNLIPEDPAVLRLQVALSSHSRLYTLLRDALVPARARLTTPPPPDTREATELRRHARDNQLALAAANYRANLRRMISMAEGVGARVLLTQVVSDLRYPPHASAHFQWLEPGELQRFNQALALGLQGGEGARSALEEAVALDPTYAQASFALGELLLAAGEAGRAKQLLVQAKDYDVVPLRAWSQVVEGMGEVAGERGVALLDAREILAGPDGLPERSWFVDELHLTAAAHVKLAERMRPEVLKVIEGSP